MENRSSTKNKLVKLLIIEVCRYLILFQLILIKKWYHIFLASIICIIGGIWSGGILNGLLEIHVDDEVFKRVSNWADSKMQSEVKKTFIIGLGFHFGRNYARRRYKINIINKIIYVGMTLVMASPAFLRLISSR